MVALPVTNLDRRDFDRRDLTVSAELHIPSGVRRGDLVNLSRSGAQVCLTNPPATGSPALLKWGDHEAMGQIVWVRSDSCAIRFDRLLAEEAVERSAGEAVARSRPTASVRNIPVGKARSGRIS